MRKATLYFLVIIAAMSCIVSCASIATPTGGPRDEDPPRFVTSSPLQGAVDVKPNKIVLTFDELVTLKDAFSKVVVSPPPVQTPRISSLGRKVTVDFRDTLLPETTYTIDFGDAIADNNEGNLLENFIYIFSTGPVLDSLMVSGMVLGAEDLQPAKGIYVGLHTNLEDSAFRKTRFDRIAKTDENGKFVIGGLAPGKYRIFALEDKDGDLAWSSPDESLAFFDTLLEPYTEQTQATDTLFNLITGEVDSIIKRGRTRFLPNNILLRNYNTGFAQQYISKYERQDSTKINFLFNTAADSMPEVNILLPDNSSFAVDEVAVTERSATNDTLTFWLKDPDVIATDTLRVAVRYLRADSVYNLVPVNDTLRLTTSRPNVKLKKSDQKKEKTDTLTLPIPTIEWKALNAKPEVNQRLILVLPTPPEETDFSMFKLQWKEDSVWKPVTDFTVDNIRGDSLNVRRLAIDYPWQFETAYRLTIDSLATRDIYGLYSDDFTLEFTTRPETEYGSLKFNLSNMGPQDISRFVELLDGQGKPLKKAPLDGGSASFNFLLPGKYNIRVIEDYNGNGKWDPGNFNEGLQPDLAYYYKETIELKANWDQEIDWNVFGTAVDKMLPESLRPKTTSNSRSR